MHLTLDFAIFRHLNLGEALILSEYRSSYINWAVVMFESTVQGFFFVE